MNLPARNSLAIIGAGPVGLEAAALALEHGFDVHVFERSQAAAHPLAWGHVSMFTPWESNIGPAAARLLARNGWSAPDPRALPTGAELAEQYLLPLAATPELKPLVHEHAQIVHIARRGALKGDLLGDPARRDLPFRLLARDAGGHESVLHAYAVIDASGTYGTPNWAGTGGIPARGELYLAPQMSYHCDDVLALRRERHAGKRTLVIGGGASAATTILALAQLAAEVPGTTALWATRDGGAFADGLSPGVTDDPLPARAALYAAARALRDGGNPAIEWTGGAEVEGFEYNSATHRYRVTLAIGDGTRIAEADQVIVNTGFGPDNSLYRELQFHECYASRGPMKLAAVLQGAGTTDCLAMPAGDADALSSPEPDFWIVGAKSYGRNGAFVLSTGYAQAATVIAQLAARLNELAAR